MKLAILLALALASTNLFAAGAHTKADGALATPVIERDSGFAYNTTSDDGTLALSFNGQSPYDVGAEATVNHTSVTVRDVRVFFDYLFVRATVQGTCDGSIQTSHYWDWDSLKVYQGDLDLPLPPNPIAPNTVLPFKGGAVVFNAILSDDHSMDITGITLLFDDGATFTFAHAMADLGCTTPVELTLFSVE